MTKDPYKGLVAGVCSTVDVEVSFLVKALATAWNAALVSLLRLLAGLDKQDLAFRQFLDIFVQPKMVP